MPAVPAIQVPGPRQFEPSAQRTIDLAEVWDDLISRRFRVSGYAHTDQHCWLALTSAPHSVPKRAHPTQLRVTERLLLGVPQKVVALEVGLTQSTVAIAFARCVKSLGIPCRMQNVPLVVAMAVHAARGKSRLRIASESLRSDAGQTHRTITCVRPDLRLSRLLPREQLAVVRLLLEGKSQREIAAHRRRSVRTVANQLRQVYLRLGVCGRAGLIAWLVRASEPA